MSKKLAFTIFRLSAVFIGIPLLIYLIIIIRFSILDKDDISKYLKELYAETPFVNIDIEGDFKLSFFPLPQISINKMILKNPLLASDSDDFSISNISFNMNPWRLILGQAKVSKIKLENAIINIADTSKINAELTLNESLAFISNFNSIEIMNSTIIFNNEISSTNVITEIEKLSFNLKSNNANINFIGIINQTDVNFELSTSDLSLLSEGVPVSIQVAINIPDNKIILQGAFEVFNNTFESNFLINYTSEKLSPMASLFGKDTIRELLILPINTDAISNVVVEAHLSTRQNIIKLSRIKFEADLLAGGNLEGDGQINDLIRSQEYTFAIYGETNNIKAVLNPSELLEQFPDLIIPVRTNFTINKSPNESIRINLSYLEIAGINFEGDIYYYLSEKKKNLNLYLSTPTIRLDNYNWLNKLPLVVKDAQNFEEETNLTNKNYLINSLLIAPEIEFDLQIDEVIFPNFEIRNSLNNLSITSNNIKNLNMQGEIENGNYQIELGSDIKSETTEINVSKIFLSHFTTSNFLNLFDFPNYISADFNLSLQGNFNISNYDLRLINRNLNGWLGLGPSSIEYDKFYNDLNLGNFYPLITHNDSSKVKIGDCSFGDVIIEDDIIKLNRFHIGSRDVDIVTNANYDGINNILNLDIWATRNTGEAHNLEVLSLKTIGDEIAVISNPNINLKRSLKKQKVNSLNMSNLFSGNEARKSCNLFN